MKYKLLFIILVIITALIIAAGYLWFKDKTLVMDERFHYDQIVRFTKGDFSLHPALSMGPGYHLFMAVATGLLNITSVPLVRLTSLMINLLAIPVFYITARKFNPKTAGIKSLWFLLFPINFPHFLFTYSDIFSCMLVIGSFYLISEKQYQQAGLVGIISMIVRQNNIIWYFFLYGLIYLQENGWRWEKGLFYKHIRKNSIFLLGFLLFFLFLLVNRGMTIGTGTKYYRPVVLNLNNLFFLLFVFFFLFLPGNIAKAGEIIRLIKRNRLIIIGLVLFYLLFLATFYNTHPWNQATYFLRNKILTWAVTDYVTKSLFFLPMAYSLLSLLTTKLYDKNYLLVYPAALLLIIPVWLVEPRYYLTAFAFFMLLNKSLSEKVIYLSVIYSLLISPYIFYGTVAGWFYP